MKFNFFKKKKEAMLNKLLCAVCGEPENELNKQISLLRISSRYRTGLYENPRFLPIHLYCFDNSFLLDADSVSMDYPKLVPPNNVLLEPK